MKHREEPGLAAGAESGNRRNDYGKKTMIAATGAQRPFPPSLILTALTGSLFYYFTGRQ